MFTNHDDFSLLYCTVQGNFGKMRVRVFSLRLVVLWGIEMDSIHVMRLGEHCRWACSNLMSKVSPLLIGFMPTKIGTARCMIGNKTSELCQDVKRALYSTYLPKNPAWFPNTLITPFTAINLVHRNSFRKLFKSSIICWVRPHVQAWLNCSERGTLNP